MRCAKRLLLFIWHCEFRRLVLPRGMGSFEARKSSASNLPIPLGFKAGSLKLTVLKDAPLWPPAASAM